MSAFLKNLPGGVEARSEERLHLGGLLMLDRYLLCDRRHIHTSTVFGRAKTTYRPLPGLSSNLTLYAVSRHYIRGADRAIGCFDEAIYAPSRADIADNVLLDATALYRVAEGLELSLTGPNLLNMRKPECFYGDKRRANVRSACTSHPAIRLRWAGAKRRRPGLSSLNHRQETKQIYGQPELLVPLR